MNNVQVRLRNGSDIRQTRLLTVGAAALLAAVVALLGWPDIGSSAAITSWRATASLPEPFVSMNAVQHGNYLYVVGGKSTSSADFGVSDQVYVGMLAGSGEVSGWTTTQSLPQRLFLHGTVATSDHLYVIGGYSGSSSTDRVWRAPFLAAGGLGPWERQQDLPAARHFVPAVLVGNRIYVMGGYRDGELFESVYFATITDEGISEWTRTRNLPLALYRHRAVAHNGAIYVIGGRSGVDRAEVYMARPDANGFIADWTQVTSLPSPRSYHGAVVRDGRIVVLGGRAETVELAEVLSAPLLADGTLGEWTAEMPLPAARYRIGAATAGRTAADPIYVVGGLQGEDLQQTVYRSSIPPTPTPTATATPLPTPTPGPAPALAMTLRNSPAGWIAPGDEIRYDIQYQNTDDQPLENLEITARIPELTTLVEGGIEDGAAAGHSVSAPTAGGVITWQLGSLAAGGEGAVAYRVARLPQQAPPVPFALDIGKTAPAHVAPGDEIEYTLTITNLVPIAFTNLLVEDRMPAGADYRSGGDAAPEDGIVRWTIPALAPESTVDVTYTVTAEKSIVNVDYRVTAEGGSSAVGREPVVTMVGDTALYAGVDGVVIANGSVGAAWEQEGVPTSVTAKPVRNPSLFDLFLPYVLQR